MSQLVVCGAGTMGSGIAQVAASAGDQTVVFDVSKEVLARAAERLQNSLDALVQKGKIDLRAKDSILRHIRFTNDINDCKGQVVIEAVVERLEVKVQLLQQLAALNAPETILASNTSSLSITELAAALPGPERVAGLHFFNPAPVMKLVEVVKGRQTNAHVADTLVALVKKWNKVPVVCTDSPGFIVNRVARPFYIESLRLLEEGVADIATIDRLLEARGFKMGPFRLMDLIGNDVNYAVSCSVYEQLGRPARLQPSHIQEEKVKTGRLGKKTGGGYYNYE
jgi:3-hydroxybutyryl-CoA dehydrogenase